MQEEWSAMQTSDEKLAPPWAHVGVDVRRESTLYATQLIWGKNKFRHYSQPSFIFLQLFGAVQQDDEMAVLQEIQQELLAEGVFLSQQQCSKFLPSS